MTNPLPIEFPSVTIEGIDQDTKNLIEETSDSISRVAWRIEPETVAQVIRAAMLAAYRCWEMAESEKHAVSIEIWKR